MFVDTGSAENVFMSKQYYWSFIFRKYMAIIVENMQIRSSRVLGR